MNWSQDATRVYLSIPLEGKTSKGVKVGLCNERITVSRGSQIFFSNTLAYPTRESDMFWYVDSGIIEISLAKTELNTWSKVFVTDLEIPPEDIIQESVTDISLFDAETRMMITKMMVEQKKE